MALKLTSRQARRAIIVGGVASILALAACQTGPRRPPEPGEIEPPPTGLNYNGVAVIVPLTGPDGPVGTSISNAARLALIDTGEKTIRVSVYDSAAPGGAAAAAQRAIAEGNRLILGPLLAEDVRAAAPVARKAGVPIIAYSNDDGVAGNGVYIMGFTPDQSIGRVVSYARSRGLNSFGALVPSGLYGQRAGQAFLGAVRKSGGRLVSMETYDRSPASLTAAARRLNAKGAVDAVLIGDASRMAASAGPALKTGPRRLGTELWSTDRTVNQLRPLRGAWFAAAPDGQFDRLVARYRARYGKTPYRLASLGYDSVLLAVRSGKSWPVGSFRFDRNGIAERLLEVREVTQTGTTSVSPAGKVF